MKRLLSNVIVLTILLSAIFVSCVTGPVEKIILDKNSAVLLTNSTLTLNATTYPSDISVSKLTWTSDNPSVATVKDGVVSAISDGVATITAATKRGNDAESCTILVTSKTIYMPGMVDGKAVLWRNGIIEELEEAELSWALSVSVSNTNDVYIAGSKQFDDPRLWKNGVLQNLENGVYGCAYSVFASEDDVYTVGEGILPGMGKSVARLWKNGIIQNLDGTDNDGHALSVFVSENNDVYVAGRSDGKAVLWKNGSIKYLENGECRFSSVFVSGDDIYVVGYVDAETGWIATLWKNGVAHYLATGNSYAKASSVFVSGDDVYVLGAIDETLTLWKNGIIQYLENAGLGQTSSLFVSGNNVYVTDLGKLWLNGNVFNVKGDYRGIFVK